MRSRVLSRLVATNAAWPAMDLPFRLGETDSDAGWPDPGDPYPRCRALSDPTPLLERFQDHIGSQEQLGIFPLNCYSGTELRFDGPFVHPAGKLISFTPRRDDFWNGWWECDFDTHTRGVLFAGIDASWCIFHDIPRESGRLAFMAETAIYNGFLRTWPEWYKLVE